MKCLFCGPRCTWVNEKSREIKRGGLTSFLPAALSEQNHKWRLFASNVSHSSAFIFCQFVLYFHVLGFFFILLPPLSLSLGPLEHLFFNCRHYDSELKNLNSVFRKTTLKIPPITISVKWGIFLTFLSLNILNLYNRNNIYTYFKVL